MRGARTGTLTLDCLCHSALTSTSPLSLARPQDQTVKQKAKRWAAASYARVRTVTRTALRPSQRIAMTTSRSAVRLPADSLFFSLPKRTFPDRFAEWMYSFRLGHEPGLGVEQVPRCQLAGIGRWSLPRHAARRYRKGECLFRSPEETLFFGWLHCAN